MGVSKDQRREIIKKYAEEIQKVISEGTVGDYTWEGLLLYFLQEIEGANRPTSTFRETQQENRYNGQHGRSIL